jgi:hypothetical protein
LLDSLFYGAFSVTKLLVFVSMIGCQVNDDDEQTMTNIHALSGIQTHSLSVQVIKAYASDRVANGTGSFFTFELSALRPAMLIGVTRVSSAQPEL